jgi:hypothetical protein
MQHLRQQAAACQTLKFYMSAPMGAMLSACFSVSLPVNFSVMGRYSFFDGSAHGEGD